MEIEVLGHKGKITSIKPYPPTQFVIWIEVYEAFANGTIGFAVLIPANPYYTKPEFLKLVTTEAENDMTASLQQYAIDKAKQDKEREISRQLHAMAGKLAKKFGV
jgi:hypothetical protein